MRCCDMLCRIRAFFRANVLNLRQSRSTPQQSLYVFAIDLFEHVIREIDTVDIPPALARGMARVLEIFIRRFEEAEVEPIHRDLGKQVTAKQNAIGEAQEKLRAV